MSWQGYWQVPLTQRAREISTREMLKQHFKEWLAFSIRTHATGVGLCGMSVVSMESV